MVGKLSGRHALVTGASRGFGRAIALALAREGASVVVNYLSRADRAGEVVKEVEAAGSRAIAVQADVSRAHDVRRLFAESDRFSGGAVDVLVNNAGFNKALPFLDIPEEDLDRVLAVNFKGAFLCTQEAGRRMLARGSGRIVNVGSVAGLLARPGSVHYGAAKAALHSLTRSAAEALAPHVQVNALAPGFFDTELNAYIQGERRDRLTAQIPARRWGSPEEVAEAVAFLATGPTYLTGQVIPLDGGIANVYAIL